MPLSDNYDSSFSGVSFMELFDSNFSADESADADATKVHYPGGNNNAIKDGGNDSADVTVNFAAETADWNSLKTKLGSSGTLVCRSGDINATYYLKSYRATKLKGGFGIYKGSLTFWKD